MADAWGPIFRDHLKAVSAPHFIERDDGKTEMFETGEAYFRAPRLDAERVLLDRLRGPVLDLGAGAGSYALYLQSLGLEVTAADGSPIAVDVCRSRGCRDARVMDLRRLELEPGAFGAVIIMGNTVGAHQTPDSLPRLLKEISRGVRPGGHLLVSMIEPLDTDDPAHLAYHRSNRARGLPPGLTRIRIRYRGIEEDWMHLWMPTEAEFSDALDASGWVLEEERAEGPVRVRLLGQRPSN